MSHLVNYEAIIIQGVVSVIVAGYSRGSGTQMRVLLILPDGHIHKLQIGSFTRSMREAPLTLTTLAALTPPDLDIELRLADESIESLPLDWPADLVGISVLTGTSPRAYELARHYRERGAKVVLGGVHVRIYPDEAATHADIIVVGRAERTWPRLLRDFSSGYFETRYEDEDPPDGWIRDVPVPRRDLLRRGRYTMPNSVMATRGCRHACDFCSVPTAWHGFQRRPVSDVITDIRTLKGKYFVFNDVSLTDDPQYARELFKELTPLKKTWGGLATTQIVNDPEMLDMMAASGCRYLLIGFESLKQSALAEISKGFNHEKSYQRLMETLHGYGVSVQGCFIFGFDDDDPGVFAQTVERVNDLRVDIPRYSILTPYPETRLFHRLTAEGRILSVNWGDYDTMHVVFEPARMSPERLYDGFKWAYRETFRLPHIVRRTGAFGTTAWVNLIGNLTYRRFVRRLYTDGRFALPYTSGHAPDSLAESNRCLV